MQAQGRRLLPWLAFVTAVSFILAVYWAKRPIPNWDMVPYIAVALFDAGTPASQVHDLTYASLDAAPQKNRELLIEGNAWRLRVAHDAEQFLALLPFYSVKPLYPWLVSLEYRAGVLLPDATVIVSATSYALISILLFVWLLHLVPAGLAAVLACGVAVTPVLTRLAALSTPDALSVLIILTGLYLSFVKDRDGVAIAVLIFSITARPENLLYAVGLSLYLAFTRKVSRLTLAASCLAALALFITINKLSGDYDHATLFYYTYVDHNIDLRHFVSPLGWREYAQIYLKGLHEMIFDPANYFSVVAPLALSTVVIVMIRGAWSDRYFHLLCLAGVCAVARYAVLPSDFWRAFAVPYLMTLIAFVAVCWRLVDGTIGNRLRAGAGLAKLDTRSDAAL